MAALLKRRPRWARYGSSRRSSRSDFQESAVIIEKQEDVTEAVLR
jgi:hypothetical protein